MSITHSAVIERSNGNKKITYNSSSPDEIALVNAAAFFGFKYFEKENLTNTIKIKTNDDLIREYKILNLFEFDSDRKRMSVIVKDQNDNIRMYCKGADSIMLNLLSRDFIN